MDYSAPREWFASRDEPDLRETIGAEQMGSCGLLYLPPMNDRARDREGHMIAWVVTADEGLRFVDAGLPPDDCVSHTLDGHARIYPDLQLSPFFYCVCSGRDAARDRGAPLRSPVKLEG